MSWTYKVLVHRDIAPNRLEAGDFAIRLFEAQWAYQISPRTLIRVILVTMDGVNWEVTLEIEDEE